MLLQAGANAKATNRYGLPPITLAATNGSAKAIERCSKAGADPNTGRRRRAGADDRGAHGHVTRARSC